MALVMDKVTAQLTATGATDSVAGSPHSIKVSGTFTGTIAFEILDAHGEWLTLKDDSDTAVSVTGADSAVDFTKVANTGVSEEIRGNVTAYTSGTINVDIRVGNRGAV